MIFNFKPVKEEFFYYCFFHCARVQKRKILLDWTICEINNSKEKKTVVSLLFLFKRSLLKKERQTRGKSLLESWGTTFLPD